MLGSFDLRSPGDVAALCCAVCIGLVLLAAVWP